MSVVANSEITQQVLEWGFQNDDFWDLDARYRYIFLATGDYPQEFEGIGEYAVLADEYPGGDLIFAKKLINPALLKKWNILVLNANAKRALAIKQANEHFKRSKKPFEMISDESNWAAAVHPCARPTCEWQGSMFDDRGPFSHVESDTIEGAIKQLFEYSREWKRSPGAVDQVFAVKSRFKRIY
jgi:hypothetical protein